MASEPVKAASVGLGRWSKVIATAVGRSDKLEIVSCFDVVEDNVNAFTQQFGCEKASSYEELLADDRIEAILCTTPNHYHLETISKAAAAGKAVYTEKPIAHTVADGRKIAEAIEKAGVTFCVGHSARMLGASRLMKEQVDSGALGNITFYEGNWSNERALELTPNAWRYFREFAPGGPLIQLLVHHFDTMQYILGPVAEVKAYTRRLQTTAEVDDAVAVICEFEDGYLGYIGSSWVSPGIYWMNIYGTEANLYHVRNNRNSLGITQQSFRHTLLRNVYNSGQDVDCILNLVFFAGFCIGTDRGDQGKDKNQEKENFGPFYAHRYTPC